MILVCLAGYGVPALLLFAAFKIHPVIGFLLEVLWCWQIPATKCLKDESMKVYQKLKENDLPGARYAVSMIVGRDTENLSETGVTKGNDRGEYVGRCHCTAPLSCHRRTGSGLSV